MEDTSPVMSVFPSLLGLSLKLSLCQLYRYNCGNTFPYILAAEFFVAVLEYSEFFAVIVENSCKRGLKSCFMSTAVNGINIVCK